MPSTADPTNALSRYLPTPLRVGEPAVAGALAVFPVFGGAPQLTYLAFSQACEHGLALKELESGASVNNLLVDNPTGHSVLLYEGEEVLGAQQNRTFDVSVLVPPHTRLRVPVSCVEAGRWDGARHDEAFAPSPQAAYPELRRAKARAVRSRLAAGLDARAAQGEVWEAVAAKSARLGVQSPTAAMHDVYEQRRDRLHDVRAEVELREGQVGSLASIGGRFAVLDVVSRPDVYAVLHAPLVQGYALDAEEALDGQVPGREDASAWLESLWAAGLSERDGIGLGREVRFEQQGRVGSGVVAGDELIQLSVFADDASNPHHAATRIRRPSRRHRP
jgi:hypothetical protein